MAEIGFSLTSKLIEALASSSIQKICSLWKYQSQLEKLKITVSRIQNVFLDADACWEQLNEQQRGFIMELKDVVCDAEDIFDEFRTRAELNQLGKNKKSKVRKLFEKLRSIFPFDKNHNHAYRLSGDVMDIIERLEHMAGDHRKFDLPVDNKPIVRRSNETCSYVDAHKIIGRDEVKDKIISVLLDSTFQNEFCFYFIVGMGGLGKTALAQLVFNDEKIQAEFPADSTYRLWVCVSDQDSEEFDEKVILSKILELITGEKKYYDSLKELVVAEFQEKIRGKKYVLVLDDVWNEDRVKWSRLEDFLRMGHVGSKIIVTTRSEETTNIIDKKHVHKLDALSQEDSQCLFEMSAFGKGENNEEHLEIGEKLVGKCHGNPLAIKVVGSLLYGQDISKWRSIERSGLADLDKGNIDKGNRDRIFPILKLSYYNLTPSLKSCFRYCAIFPKDSNMEKEMLFGLWIAQGYIVPIDNQSVEDVVEGHFSILMRRCFFQDIEKDEYGNVVCVKIHDLMHDVAQEVGNEEICVVTSVMSKSGERIRHLNINDECSEISLHKNKIRSYIFNGWNWKGHSLDKELEKFTALRVLDLCNLSVASLSKTLDRLILLRYLNLSGTSGWEVLPNSIAGLHNLHTLVIRFCRDLREGPKDLFSNLMNLVNLDLYGSEKLNMMCLGILKLRNLRMLPYFVASNEFSDEELGVLQQVFSKLKGKVDILGLDDVNDMGRRLVNLEIDEVEREGKWVINEDVLAKLELPTYLKELSLSWYNGKTVPWQAISLPNNLIRILIRSCEKLEQIWVLSKLPHLKSLALVCLNSVEYMESEMSLSNNDINVVVDFFPSLESLLIEDMKELKGWWKEDFLRIQFRFPNLSDLTITDCPKLALNLLCPNPEELKVKRSSEMLLITGVKVKEMNVDQVEYLKLLPPTCNSLTSLILNGEINVESALECLQNRVSSLQTLRFSECKNLKRLPRLDHLIALEELTFYDNEELSICEEDDDEEPLKSFPQSLCTLKFFYHPKMKILPKGIQHLTSLQSLKLECCVNMELGIPERISSLSSLQLLSISRCPGIKSLPETIRDLTSLKKLHISDCPGIKSLPEAIRDLTSLEELLLSSTPDLIERCDKPSGADFPKIKHIPCVYIHGLNIMEKWGPKS